jgi:hypothetical protein
MEDNTESSWLCQSLIAKIEMSWMATEVEKHFLVYLPRTEIYPGNESIRCDFSSREVKKVIDPCSFTYLLLQTSLMLQGRRRRKPLIHGYRRLREKRHHPGIR